MYADNGRIKIQFLNSRDSLTDAFGDSKCDNGDYRKSPAPEDDMMGASAHQRPSGMLCSCECRAQI